MGLVMILRKKRKIVITRAGVGYINHFSVVKKDYNKFCNAIDALTDGADIDAVVVFVAVTIVVACGCEKELCTNLPYY